MLTSKHPSTINLTSTNINYSITTYNESPDVQSEVVLASFMKYDSEFLWTAKSTHLNEYHGFFYSRFKTGSRSETPN